MFRQFKQKNKNLLRLKLKSALKIEQIIIQDYIFIKKIQDLCVHDLFCLLKVNNMKY
jgi:hypothetical protein